MNACTHAHPRRPEPYFGLSGVFVYVRPSIQADTDKIYGCVEHSDLDDYVCV